MSMQFPSQHWLPGGQRSQMGGGTGTQMPFSHAPPFGHTTPQLPQLSSSLDVSVQPSAQHDSNGGQPVDAQLLIRRLAGTVQAERRGSRANVAARAAVVRVGLDVRRTVRVAPAVLDHALAYRRVAARPRGTVRVRTARRANPDPELALKGRPRAAGEEREKKKYDGEWQTA